MKNSSRIALAIAGAVSLSALSTPAYAGTGCNGVVAWWVWGCAPWDNNNGPQFPYYRKQQVSIPAGSKITINGNAASATVNGQQIPIAGGASVVAQGGGNVVAQGGGNIVASGGGNLRGWSGQ